MNTTQGRSCGCFQKEKIERIWCKSKGIKGVDGNGAARLGISWGLVLEGEMTDFDPKMWLCSQGGGEAAGLGGSSSVQLILPLQPSPESAP